MNEPQLDSLIESACAVRQHAHAPTSGFLVGAALLTADGSIFVGCNVENKSLGLTQCAERSAVTAAVAAGQQELKQLVVASDGGASPCGACRQVLSEFADQLSIHIVDTRGGSGELVETVELADLLPLPFRGIGGD
jgi:cytidine deaminase